MQSTKDSFYIAVRDRLVAIDPNRTITLDGVTRPAIAVVENEPPSGAPPLCDVFYLHWGDLRPAPGSSNGLMTLDCVITYCTKGATQNGGLDRGRDLAGLDGDLLAISSPPHTPKRDYSGGSPVGLGSTIFWTEPLLNFAKSAPPYVGREAAVTVFFYPEANQS